MSLHTDLFSPRCTLPEAVPTSSQNSRESESELVQKDISAGPLMPSRLPFLENQRSWGTSLRYTYTVLCVVVVIWGGFGFAQEAKAGFYPSAYLGGKLPELHSVVGVDLGYMWEWDKVALTLSLPVETDFGTRVAFGPKFFFEANRYFRVITAVMGEAGVGSKVGAFGMFVRAGLAAGFRSTGRDDARVTSDPAGNSPIRAGAYLTLLADYRIADFGTPIKERFRFLFLIKVDLVL